MDGLPNTAGSAPPGLRHLDPALRERLRERAARNGRSIEAEARSILEAALTGGAAITAETLVATIRGRFAPFGGVELELPPRGPGREPPRFE